MLKSFVTGSIALLVLSASAVRADDEKQKDARASADHRQIQVEVKRADGSDKSVRVHVQRIETDGKGPIQVEVHAIQAADGKVQVLAAPAKKGEVGGIIVGQATVVVDGKDGTKKQTVTKQFQLKEPARVRLRALQNGDSKVLKWIPAEQPSVTLHGGTVASVAVSDFWIGIACQPVSDVLRAQLNLPGKGGVVVESVIPKSPAEKAGLKQHDVLIAIGDHLINEPTDLIKIIAKGKDRELPITVIRGGQKQMVKVKPAKRPAHGELKVDILGTPESGDWKKLQGILEQVIPGRGPDVKAQGLSFRILGPGAILPNRTRILSAALPGNLSISIHKQGDEPAKISVKRGDDKWEVTEKELDKLPEDVRPHVQRMLGTTALGLGKAHAIHVLPNVKVPLNVHPKVITEGFHFQAAPDGPVKDRIEKRLDQMNRRMERLHELVEDLRENRPRLRDTDEEEDGEDDDEDEDADEDEEEDDEEE